MKSTSLGKKAGRISATRKLLGNRSTDQPAQLGLEPRPFRDPEDAGIGQAGRQDKKDQGAQARRQQPADEKTSATGQQRGGGRHANLAPQSQGEKPANRHHGGRRGAHHGHAVGQGNADESKTLQKEEREQHGGGGPGGAQGQRQSGMTQGGERADQRARQVGAGPMDRQQVQRGQGGEPPVGENQLDQPGGAG